MPKDLDDHTYILFDITSLISFRMVRKGFFEPVLNQTTLYKLKELFVEGYRLDNCSFSILSHTIANQFLIKTVLGHRRFVDEEVIVRALKLLIPILIEIGVVSPLANGEVCIHNAFYTYDASKKDELLFEFHGIDPSKALLFSDDDRVINSAIRLGCSAIRTYNHGELDQGALEKLKVCPLLPDALSSKRVVFELDVDDTLLSFESTFFKRKTVLNHYVTDFLREFCQIYFDAEIVFNIVTSRVPEHETCAIKFFSIDSIIKELSKLERFYIEITDTSFVEKLDENGKRKKLCTKAEDILLRAKEENIKNTLYVFLDDDFMQIEKALYLADEFKNIHTEIIPIQVHRNGDLTEKVLSALKQHSILFTNTNETQQNPLQMKKMDMPTNRP